VKFSHHVEGFKMEQRAAIKFCVKLKETATEMFEMLKSAYAEESLSRTSMFEWHKMFKEAQKVRMQKSQVKTMLTVFFGAKGVIHHKFVQEKQTVNGKFYKGVIKRLIPQVHHVRPESQESGSQYLLHDSAQAHSSGFFSEFLAKRGIPYYPIRPTPQILCLQTFF
jgi:hypothetical protein